MARRPRPNPLTVRFSPEDRDELARRAAQAGLSLGGYLHVTALDAPMPRMHRLDTEALVRLLGAVGSAGGNINQLAKVANTGGWPESHALAQAAADIRTIRDTLMLALGITPSGPAP